jgi:hypothetical protein
MRPEHWYLNDEDEYMSEKLRLEHERLNSFTFKNCKKATALYTADQLQQAKVEVLREAAGEMSIASDYAILWHRADEIERSKT